jgi:phosphohistidine swiveling domain-containing protein
MENESYDPIRGSSEPDRFWSGTNISEAAPDVLSPMCWSFWSDAAELGWRGSLGQIGVLPRRMVVVPPDPNDRHFSIFYGRLALNVDRIIADVASPVLKARDLERDIIGSVREDSQEVKGSIRRIPIIMLRAPIAFRKGVPTVARLYDETREWWQTDVFDVSRGLREPSLTALERLIDARQRYARVFAAHSFSRIMVQALQSAIVDAAAKAGDPGLAPAALSGVGELLETQMSDDIWKLANDEIEMETFLREWGFHGPSEGNVYATSWREDHGPVEAVARSIRHSSGVRPAERERGTVAANLDAERRLLAGSSAVQRPLLRWLLKWTRSVIRTLHLGKSAYVMAFDGGRAAARAFGAEQVAAGAVAEADDVFFLSIEECRELAAGQLLDVGSLVAERRAARAKYRSMILPNTWIGMPEPVRDGDSVRIAEAEADRAAGRPVVITGADAGGSEVEGRVRLVRDSDEDVELDDGDILVCRFTDPSWAPLMSVASAFVIDIGASASHGAVVARELGLPYLIGTEIGTAVLREGDLVRLDPSSKSLTVLTGAHAPVEAPQQS